MVFALMEDTLSLFRQCREDLKADEILLAGLDQETVRVPVGDARVDEHVLRDGIVELSDLKETGF